MLGNFCCFRVNVLKVFVVFLAQYFCTEVTVWMTNKTKRLRITILRTRTSLNLLKKTYFDETHVSDYC